MDFSQILAASILGGAFAGAGGGLGFFLARFLPEQFKTPLIAGFAAIGLVVSQSVHGTIKAASLKSELESTLDKNDLFATIKSDFPADYTRFVDELSRVKTPNEGFEYSEKFTAELRRRNAIHARSAPSRNLQAQLATEIKLLEQIRSRDSDLICNAFLEKGVAGLPGGYESYENELSNSVEALFKALAEGRDIEQPRPSPMSADWDSLIEYWRLKGATEKDVELILSPNPQDMDYCAAHISFLSSTLTYEGSAADSIRAELLYQKAAAN